MHTILSGLKALYCNTAYEGIKQIRETCGAAGFSHLSSIPNIIDLISSYVTLEGDSVVMNIQTARSLLKSGRKVIQTGKPLNQLLEYILDLKVILEKGKDFKCDATSPEFFKNE